MNNIPTVIVVYGATGDLMARKIIPALFSLYLKNKLPVLFRLIGVSRRNIDTDGFRDLVLNIIREYYPTALKNTIEKFCLLLFYHQGEFARSEDYKKLATEMGRIDGAWHVCANKLFYLAVPPQFYETIFTRLHESGLTEPCSPEEGWTRILVEKPFGKDAHSAKRLDALLGRLFKEEQIYRIDHYLGKDMLQNILAFRFSNNILEESWNNRFIERIDIRVLENNGVEKRGAFYDPLGALRDVGQNHLLQMLALVTMDNPVNLTSSAIRTKRADILSRLVIPDEQMIKKETFRAQYKGYQSISAVRPDSTTETYFKIRARLRSSRWDGVPIYLSSGKKFKSVHKDITVTFRNPQQCLTCAPGNIHQNKVIFSLEPEEKINIQFFSKKPGLELVTQQKDLHFVYRSKKQRTQYVEEYEKLLLDCILGDQTLFVSTDEVIPMWQFTDAIEDGWKNNVVPLKTYVPHIDSISKQKLPIEKSPRLNLRWRKEIGIVGLGKMGGGIAMQLMDRGWRVNVYNRTPSKTDEYVRKGIFGIYDLSEFKQLKTPRIIWLMVPAGEPVDAVLFGKKGLSSFLSKGDIIIDAGNSHYIDSQVRARTLAKKGIRFIDIGISGGPEGARFGASLMVGGDRKTFEYLEPLFTDISVPRGYQFFEGVGAGHFVKMIHNGIEYGMMQAIAEGFSVLKKAPYDLDLSEIADIYNHGTVIESRLIEWLKDAFDQYGTDLKTVSSTVGHTGEGLWTVKTAKRLGIETKIISESLKFRINSSKKPTYTGKIISALRGQFGGHKVKEER